MRGFEPHRLQKIVFEQQSYQINYRYQMKTAKFCSTFLKSGKAAMAEWFKAADLRPAIIDAWVRTPLAAMPSRKGDHPKPFFMIFADHEKIITKIILINS
jgi:hypothetical protein